MATEILLYGIGIIVACRLLYRQYIHAYGMIGINQTPIVDTKGRPIPHSPDDTRFTRFSHAKEISVGNREKYGDIYTVKKGPYRELVITNPDALRAHYDGDAMAHTKLESLGFGAFLGSLLGECVGLKYGDDWRRIRRAVDPYFTHKAAMESLPAMISYIYDWASADLANMKECIHTVTGKFHIRAMDAVTVVPFKATARLMYGEKTMTDEFFQQLWSIIPLHSDLINFAFLSSLGRWKIFQYTPLPKARELRQFHNKFRALNTWMVRDAEQNEENSIVFDMYEQVKKGNLSYDEWIQTIDEILFANIDITAAAMAWMIIIIAREPGYQEKLVQEFTARAQDAKDEKQAAAYIKDNRTELHRAMTEAIRVQPVVWYGFPELTQATKNIQGYIVPSHTPATVDVYQLNTQSPIWNPPDKPKGYGNVFDPDRFLSLNATQYAWSFFRFGNGPRKCLGRNFAENLLKAEIFHIFSRYSVEVLDDVVIRRDKFTAQPECLLQFTVRE